MNNQDKLAIQDILTRIDEINEIIDACQHDIKDLEVELVAAVVANNLVACLTLNSAKLDKVLTK